MSCVFRIRIRKWPVHSRYGLRVSPPNPIDAYLLKWCGIQTNQKELQSYSLKDIIKDWDTLHMYIVIVDYNQNLFNIKICCDSHHHIQWNLSNKTKSFQKPINFIWFSGSVLREAYSFTLSWKRTHLERHNSVDILYKFHCTEFVMILNGNISSWFLIISHSDEGDRAPLYQPPPKKDTDQEGKTDGPRPSAAQLGKKRRSLSGLPTEGAHPKSAISRTASASSYSKVSKLNSKARGKISRIFIQTRLKPWVLMMPLFLTSLGQLYPRVDYEKWSGQALSPMNEDCNDSGICLMRLGKLY